MKDPAEFFEKKAKELKKQKKFEEALVFDDKARKIREEEKQPDYWLKKGFHFIEVGEFENALECFDNDLTKRGKNYEALFSMGKVYFHMGNYPEAIESFNKATEQRNESYLKKLKKSHHLKKAKKFEKALKYSDMASNEISIDSEFWYYKGLTWFKLERYDQAHTCISNALENDDKNEKFLYDLAKCELFRGKSPKCIEILKKVIEQNPSVKEKLAVDGDFTSISQDSQFRALVFQ